MGNPFNQLAELESQEENPFARIAEPNPFDILAEGEDQRGLARRAFDVTGEVVVETVKDLAGLPGRALTSAQILGESALIATELGLESLGLQEDILDFQPSFSPQETKDALNAFAFDAILFAIPAGKAAAPLAKGAGRAVAGAALRAGARQGVARGGARLAQNVVRGAATFGKFSALTPGEEEAASLEGRLELAAEGAIFGAATPVVGKVLAPIARRGQSAISSAVKAVTGLIRRKGAKEGAEEILKSNQVQLTRLFFNSFLRVPAKDVAEKELPRLFKPLTEELRKAAGEAGQIIRPEVASIIERGTVGKEAGKQLGKLARELFPETGTVLISENRVLGIKTALATAEAALSAAEKRLEVAVARGQIGKEELEKLAGFREFYSALSNQFIKVRRAAGRTLQSFQRGVNVEMLQSFAGHLERAGFQLQGNFERVLPAGRTAIQQIGDDIAAGKPLEAIRTAIRKVWPVSLVPLLSAAADTASNGVRVAEKGAEAFIHDIFDVVAGKTPVAVQAMFRGIGQAARSRTPSVLKPTVMGEQMQAIYGKKLDLILLTGARLKRAVDTRFGMVGFFSSLNRDALQEANKLGLKGVEKTSFVRRWVLEAEEKFPDAVQRALKVANELRFSEPLPGALNKAANSAFVKLTFAPFLRFNLLYTKWLSEFTAVSPKFWGKVIRNQASAEDVAEFAAKNLAGIGGVYFASETLYDDIDFDRMEYIDPETKSRRSIRGFSPLPELVAVAAIIKGDAENALRALESSSLGFFARQGLADDFFLAIERVRRGANPRIIGDELAEALTNALPGKAILVALGSAFGQEPRTGAGRNVPGLGRPKLDPLTGGPARNQKEIFLGGPIGPGFSTGIAAPPSFGSRLTETKFNQLEQLFSDLDIKTRFPAATGLLNPETGRDFDSSTDVPPEIVEEFNREVGEAREKVFANLNIDKFERLREDVQERRLRNLLSAATKTAKRKMNRRLRQLRNEQLRPSGGASIRERLDAAGTNPFGGN